MSAPRDTIDNSAAEAAVKEDSLFRKEVLQEQRTQWLGKVLLAPSLSHTVFAVFAFLSCSAILALLFFGDYTRKERINGWLVPQLGLVQVYSSQNGHITKLLVEDGSEVQAGDPLLVVSTDLESEAVGATQLEVVRRLTSRRDSLIAEQALNKRISNQQASDLVEQLRVATEELEHREEELQVQNQRVKLARQAVQRLGKYRADGSVSEEQWLEAENERLDQLMRLRELQREISVATREKRTDEARFSALPLELEKVQAQLEREIDELEQQLAEAEARRQIVVTAPQSGTVTALQLDHGSSVQASLPLMGIVPAGSDLEARLYIPTRAIGFVSPGQPVLLRYRAFPYQKFGHYDGTIAKVSRSTVSPSELPPHLRSAAQTDGVDEPVYPVTVRLENQSATAYGRAIDLQPGMELEADVLIENRRLIEWVLEPLYSLTGNMRG